MFRIFVPALLLLAASCQNQKPRDEKAFRIVEQCIEQHGGSAYRDLDVSFDFRQFRVHLKQNKGLFLYERTTTDSAGNKIHDLLTNDSFVRKVNGKPLQLTPKEQNKYREGLNAIAYFALLPYKLSEPAVNLTYAGTATIENTSYDKVSVTFDQSGGGKDYHDEFCYWISKRSHTLDYLAYSSGGPRFRKATKRQKVDGVLFQNYANFEIPDTTLSTVQYDNAYKAGQVKLVSTIEQTNYTAH